MKQTSIGYTVCLDADGYLKIPKPHRERELRSMVGGRAFLSLMPGDEKLIDINRRAGFPAAVALRANLPRSERLHHLSTFLPHGTNLNGILHGEQEIVVSIGGHLLLPELVKRQFSDTANRARLILLDHGDAGFAVTFTPRFPRGSDGR